VDEFGRSDTWQDGRVLDKYGKVMMDFRQKQKSEPKEF